jgi:hypothetical protein
MDKFNCTSCHVANWTIYPQTAGGGDENGGLPYAGDRRLFDLDVSWNKDAGRLEGELVELYDYVDGLYLPHRDGYVVEGLFSDLAHHDMGTGFDELAYDGNVNSMWRTPPLWGVGHGFPWGHDGQSLSLDDVIRRHGGEAADSAAAYASSGKGNRKKLIAFLEKLVLYDIESLPADIDGDGEIAEDFAVAGVDTGTERFNAEWLFEIPVEIQGDVANSDGGTVKSFQAVNLDDAYGLLLDLRVDTDLDGWPDVWDHAPESPGYEDGVN